MSPSKFFLVVTSLLCFSLEFVVSEEANELPQTELFDSREIAQAPKENKSFFKSSKKDNCGELPIGTQRIEVRHIESKGVGYKQGYTTLEGFFTVPSTIEGSWLPFLDLRGHVFNDGKMAANAGLGLRYMTSWVWGMNAYYDYRNTNRQHYNQFSMGLEALGKLLDFRINGYLPVGKKDSKYFDIKAKGFSGNSLILTKKQDFAMKGANAEIGFHFGNFKHVSMYSAAGPYYFEGKGKVAWGGEGRFAVDLYNYVRLQVNGSYDPVFKGIVQGEVSVMIPLGKKKQIKRRNPYTCPQEMVVKERALQRVDRNEIIVVDRKTRNTLAVDPLTGNPYVFLFVDNTSHSLGTFESPYNTLLAAENASSPNDIIYVLPGDGTDTGMNTGFTMKEGQQLLGAGTTQNLNTTSGVVQIPAMAASNPTISNLLATPIVSGANEYIPVVILNEGNNTVSGVNIVSNYVPGMSQNATGIFVESGSNYLIQNNTFSSPLMTQSVGAVVMLGADLVTIDSNKVLPTGGMLGFAFINGGGPEDANATYTISNNSVFNEIFGTPGLFASYQGFSGDISFSVLNNMVSPGDAGGGIVFISNGGTGNLSVDIKENTIFQGAGAPGLLINSFNSSSANISLNIIGNKCTGAEGAPGLNLSQNGIAPGVMTAYIQGNDFSIPKPVDANIPSYLFQNVSGDASLLQVNFGKLNKGTVEFQP